MAHIILLSKLANILFFCTPVEELHPIVQLSSSIPRDFTVLNRQGALRGVYEPVVHGAYSGRGEGEQAKGDVEAKQF